MGIEVRVAKGPRPEPTPGTGGHLSCLGGTQLAGIALTVGAVASATGGIRPGGLIETGRG